MNKKETKSGGGLSKQTAEGENKLLIFSITLATKSIR